jgi:DNA-binding CsgD family transcriptional regulator
MVGETSLASGEWPLIGRSSELQRMRRLLLDGGTRGAVLAGAAGVGKTRLALECLRMVEKAGLPTARVLATRSATALPFGALAPLLPSLHHEERTSADGRVELLRRCAAALTERAAGRRLVLLVDDAHVLDDASATLVHQLAATGAASVLATVRTGEPAPDAVVSLWKDGLLERIELGDLSTDTIGTVLTSALGGLVDGATVAGLAVRCQGNVLYLRELVMGAIQDGTLKDEGGIWRQAGPFAPSQRLVELVEARLVGLDDSERALLELVSFGEPLGPAELGALGDAHLAESLERRGLLSSHRSDRRLQIRLAHPLYGDVIRSRTPAIRLATIARALAEVVEATGARRREDTLRVATWRLESGGGSPELMLAAARTARWSNDFPLAERLARAAVNAGAGLDAQLLAAQLAGLQGRGAEADEALARLTEQVTDDEHRVFLAIARLDNSALFQGHIDEGLRVAEEAEAQIADPVWRDEVAAKRAAVLLGVKGPDAALEAAEPLLDRAQGRTLVWACAAAAYGLGRRGLVERALEAAARGYEANRSLARAVEWGPWFHLVHRCEALTLAGRFDEADLLVTEQYRLALAEKSPEAQAVFAWQRAVLSLDCGLVRTAGRYAREARALFQQLGRPQWEQFCLLHLAWALALGGRAGEAARTIAELDALDLPPALYMRADLLRAQSWVAVAEQDLQRARSLLREAATLGEAIGDRVGEGAALHDLARLGRPREALTRLVALAAEIEGPLAAARAAHAEALVGHDGQGLAEASSRFEQIGAVLLAAEAAAEAGAAWERAGRRRESSAAELRAESLAARCEGAMTPALHATASRSKLTPAEYDTALRAAAGCSNREIARELSLSVRTVENRLLAVYRKLGVQGRTGLPGALEALRGGGPAHRPAASDQAEPGSSHRMDSVGTSTRLPEMGARL